MRADDKDRVKETKERDAEVVVDKRTRQNRMEGADADAGNNHRATTRTVQDQRGELERGWGWVCERETKGRNREGRGRHDRVWAVDWQLAQTGSDRLRLAWADAGDDAGWPKRPFGRRNSGATRPKGTSSVSGRGAWDAGTYHLPQYGWYYCYYCYYY